MYLENITMRKDWRELAALAGIALAAQKVQLCTPSVFFDRKEEMPKPTCGKDVHNPWKRERKSGGKYVYSQWKSKLQKSLTTKAVLKYNNPREFSRNTREVKPYENDLSAEEKIKSESSWF